MAATMTPIGLVQAECCNYVASECMWVGPCPVASRKRCTVRAEDSNWFERTVLPLGEATDLHPSLRPMYASAAESYRGLHALKRLREKRERCECGEHRPTRHKYCVACALKYKREARRKKQAKWRTDLSGCL